MKEWKMIIKEEQLEIQLFSDIAPSIGSTLIYKDNTYKVIDVLYNVDIKHIIIKVKNIESKNLVFHSIAHIAQYLNTTNEYANTIISNGQLPINKHELNKIMENFMSVSDIMKKTTLLKSKTTYERKIKHLLNNEEQLFPEMKLKTKRNGKRAYVFTKHVSLILIKELKKYWSD